MDRKILTGVIITVLLLLAAALLLPGGKAPESTPLLPWQIDIDAQGNSHVFGLTLGQSTLDDARTIFGEEGKVQLFVSPTADYSIEAYFSRISLSGLKADIILTLEIGQEEAAGMYERGVRQEQASAGTKKISLSAEDQAIVTRKPIRLLSYVPAANLDEQLIISRFGEPTSRLPDAENALHLLYPEKGLDISLNPEGKELFQYCAPSQFIQLLLAPLNTKRPATTEKN